MSSNKDHTYGILNQVLLQLRFYDVGSRIISNYSLRGVKRRRGNDKRWNSQDEMDNVIEYINKYYCDEEVI